VSGVGRAAGTAAEPVAIRLERRIRARLAADPHAFSPSDGTTITQARPLLVIADRTIDLPVTLPTGICRCAARTQFGPPITRDVGVQVMLHHASDYQSLALDCLNLRMNRVTLYEDEDTREEDGGSTKSTSAHETVTSVSIRHRSSCCGAQFGAIAM